MATLQAIETRYKGYRFRSRLEARWAVFFDTLGVQWEYEKEGYVLPMPEMPEPDAVALMQHGYDGCLAIWEEQHITSEPLRYLPDFWLPELECWIEIKGAAPSKEDEEKAHRLAMHSGDPVYVFFGQDMSPDNDGGYVLMPEGHWDCSRYWCECPHCLTLGIEFEGTWTRIGCGCRGGDDLSADAPRILAAYEAARAARFEFGEAG